MVAVTVMLALLLAVESLASGSGGSTGGNRGKTLQSCPATEEEIVDLELLAEGLKDSRAVGLFEKIRLRSAINDLIERLQAFHLGNSTFSLAELQEQYDVLLMRIAANLQHKDVILHGQLCNAWEMIWQDLEDPKRFEEKFS